MICSDWSSSSRHSNTPGEISFFSRRWNKDSTWTSLISRLTKPTDSIWSTCKRYWANVDRCRWIPPNWSVWKVLFSSRQTRSYSTISRPSHLCTNKLNSFFTLISISNILRNRIVSFNCCLSSRRFDSFRRWPSKRSSSGKRSEIKSKWSNWWRICSKWLFMLRMCVRRCRLDWAWLFSFLLLYSADIDGQRLLSSLFSSLVSSFVTRWNQIYSVLFNWDNAREMLLVAKVNSPVTCSSRILYEMYSIDSIQRQDFRNWLEETMWMSTVQCLAMEVSRVSLDADRLSRGRSRRSAENRRCAVTIELKHAHDYPTRHWPYWLDSPLDWMDSGERQWSLHVIIAHSDQYDGWRPSQEVVV